MVAMGPGKMRVASPPPSTSHKNRTLAEVEEAKHYGMTIESYHELTTNLEQRWRDKVRGKVQDEERESLREEVIYEVRQELRDELKAEVAKEWTDEQRQTIEQQVRSQQEKRVVTDADRAVALDHIQRFRLEALLVSEACIIEANELAADKRSSRGPFVVVATLWPLLVYLSLTHFGPVAAGAVALSLSLLARGLYVGESEREEHLREQAVEARQYADNYEHDARIMLPAATFMTDLRALGQAREYRRALPSPDAMDKARRMMENREALSLDTRSLLEPRRESPRLPG